jgi:DNA-binding Xre family transcriptional regulator
MAVLLRLQEIAQKQGLTPRDLADKTGLSLERCQALVDGTYKRADLKTLDRLAQALNVDVSLLIQSDPPLPTSLTEE